MARPKIQITEKQVEALAKLGATEIEIAEVFACHASTISKRFSQIFASGRGQMKLRLRRLQWKSAAKGSIPMQIHLGKHLLGQSDASLRGVNYSPEEWGAFSIEQLDKIAVGKNPYPAPAPVPAKPVIPVMSEEERKREIKRIRAVLDADPDD